MSRCLFLGDSLIEYGDWDVLLPEFVVDNGGQAGETVEGLAARLAAEISAANEPDHLLLMSGTNNLLMGDTLFPTILESMLQPIGALLPQATVTINSLLPMDSAWLPADAVTAANRALCRIAKQGGVHFLDIHRLFLDQCSGGPRGCLAPDGVHLSAPGYSLWAQGLRTHFKSLDRLLTP